MMQLKILQLQSKLHGNAKVNNNNKKKEIKREVDK